jgi:crossover junction endodeoxyribonuclease RuvC
MICGIDPGAKGAIALLYPDYADIYDMPMLGKEVNGSEVAAILTEFRPDHIWLEQVNAFGMGRTSAFTFGQGVGVLKGVFQSLKIPFTMVTPQKWQKHYGKSSDKEHSRQLANRLFPSLADRLNRKKDDGRAEALLIAKYGSEQK